jgi:two-component system, NtrC family, response regulator AlgB
MHAATMKTVQKSLSVSGASGAPSVKPEAILTLLILGDEARSRRLLAFGLVDEGDVVTCAESAAVLRSLSLPGEFGAALIDWEMKATSAKQLLEELRELDPELPVVATVADELAARAARQAGAVCALLKPFSTEDLRALLKRNARARVPSTAETSEAQPAPAAASDTVSTAPAAIVAPGPAIDVFDSRSRCMQQVLNIALRVAPTSANVLLLGENGTGKSALARGIHERSQRQRMPFVTVNCPCLQARLLESELFGHVRGSFTGAVSDTMGKVAAAEGGTLFLDEIGELPLEIQPKLLRLLQDRQYERLGEIKTRRANIRVIAATNRDLREEVKAGRFREDLFYRLNVIALDMPSLRRRPEDIGALADEFLREARSGGSLIARSFSEDARRALMGHDWPGNLRELRNVVERAAILSDRKQLDLEDLPLFRNPQREGKPQVGDFVSLMELEQAHIREVMARTETLGHAAQILGINQATLYRKRKLMPDGDQLPATEMPAA